MDLKPVNSERGTAKTSDAEGTKFASVPRVRVGIVGRAMQ